jgi:dTDP-4-dehydrorhamnose 3,5-epimerase
MNLTTERTLLPGVILLKPRRFSDDRGYFSELYQDKTYLQAGLSQSFVQDNMSSSHEGVLRGMHFQWPQPQAKLVSVLAGRVFDVAVDIRIGSPHFGQWYGVELSAENGHQLFIPEGFAHGFCALSSNTILVYKCSDYYSPQTEKTLIWNDRDIGIEWPISTPRLSDKDQKGRRLSEFSSSELPNYSPM